MQVMRLILSGQVDPKTAGLLLYALQTASSNLSRINFEPAVKTRVVIDPHTVNQTPLGEDPWCKEDFEEEEYEEDDQEEESEPVQAMAEESDEETSAEETIANIEGRADTAQQHGREKDEQTIAQIQAVATNANRQQRRGPATHSYPARAARDSRPVRAQIRAGQSRCGGTTSIGPVSWPRPIPLSSESTYDGIS
jgi:hypothetical protein